jgi:hypothetical protein
MFFKCWQLLLVETWRLTHTRTHHLTMTVVVCYQKTTNRLQVRHGGGVCRRVDVPRVGEVGLQRRDGALEPGLLKNISALYTGLEPG